VVIKMARLLKTQQAAVGQLVTQPFQLLGYPFVLA
jgi:hypothetical protein